MEQTFNESYNNLSGMGSYVSCAFNQDVYSRNPACMTINNKITAQSQSRQYKICKQDGFDLKRRNRICKERCDMNKIEGNTDNLYERKRLFDCDKVFEQVAKIDFPSCESTQVYQNTLSDSFHNKTSTELDRNPYRNTCMQPSEIDQCFSTTQLSQTGSVRSLFFSYIYHLHRLRELGFG